MILVFLTECTNTIHLDQDSVCQPGGSIVIVMTRWHKRDLTGQILKAQQKREGVDDWEVIEFPAILPSGKSLWQEFWDIKELRKIKSRTSYIKMVCSVSTRPYFRRRSDC